MVVYFIHTDSKSNCFEHNKHNCVRSLTGLYWSTSVVAAFVLEYLNVKRQIYSGT